MDVPSYQQLLAEVYDEIPTSMFVQQTEYEDDVEPEDKHPDELEHQEEFQKEQPSRQIVEVPTSVPSYVDKTKFSVTYEKDVQTRVINIDSRFRANPNEVIATKDTITQLLTLSSSSDFLYKLGTPIKNVISIRVSSVEIPNTYYNFSAKQSNIALRIYYPSGQTSSYNDILISEGNYFVDSADNLLPNNIITELQKQLNKNSLGLTFLVTFDLISTRLTISEVSTPTKKQFDIDFITNNAFTHRKSDWGLGYNLGFNKTGYTGQNTYTGSTIVDTLDGNYIFLSLDPDWKAVKHWNSENTEVSAFAKIIINVPKNSIIYDNGSNTITKEYWFDSPKTIRSFPVKLVDTYGEVIDLLGSDISFTVELKEVMNPALYNHYTNNIQT